jgi:MraZ protein
MQQILLSGDFDHTLDPKGRITLPARYREYFQGGAVLVRLQENEPCVRVYHPESWADFDAKYIEPLNAFESEADNRRTRKIYSGLDLVEPDKQGRVLVPAKRIDELGLSGKVKILGNRTHLEIWNPDTYAAYEAQEGGGNA